MPHPTRFLEFAIMPERQTLVLIHAFPQDHAMWEEQAQAFRTEYRVFTPDVFGFGGSPLPDGDWTIEDFADELAGAMEQLGIREPFVLGGLSMGGYVALAFAKEYPEKLRGLILADTRADADSAEAKANREKSIAALATQTPAEFIEGMIPKVLGDTTRKSRPEIVERVRAIGSRQSREGIVAALKALRDRSDSTDELEDIEVPTLVIVGAEDTVTPPAISEAMAKVLPNATLEVIAEAGHLSNMEQPAAFTAAMRKWLSKL
jgi:pimeloyl-ACP methyl ester carboxylesterase